MLKKLDYSLWSQLLFFRQPIFVKQDIRTYRQGSGNQRVGCQLGVLYPITRMFCYNSLIIFMFVKYLIFDDLCYWRVWNTLFLAMNITVLLYKNTLNIKYFPISLLYYMEKNPPAIILFAVNVFFLFQI